MPLEVIPAQTEHIEGMAQALLSAFGEFHHQHEIPYTSTLPSALEMYESIIKEDFGHPIVALLDGEVAGSTWLRLSDEVIAFEDVNVAPSMQGKGIARPLMQYGIKTAQEKGYERIRLTQSGHNSKALSLYASLGFETKESFAEMSNPASPEASEDIRAATKNDLDAIAQFCKKMYKVNRRAEISDYIGRGVPCFIMERNGEIVGYKVGNSHGIAQTEDDALALASHTAREFPGNVKFHCPMGLSNFFQKAIKAGCQVGEIHNIMAIGPYETPDGAWMPSGAF